MKAVDGARSLLWEGVLDVRVRESRAYHDLARLTGDLLRESLAQTRWGEERKASDGSLNSVADVARASTVDEEFYDRLNHPIKKSTAEPG